MQYATYVELKFSPITLITLITLRAVLLTMARHNHLVGCDYRVAV